MTKPDLICAVNDRAAMAMRRLPGQTRRKFIYRARQILGLGESIVSRFGGDPKWPFGLRLLALARRSTVGDQAALDRLTASLSTLVDETGSWSQDIDRVADGMIAYALLQLWLIDPEIRWEKALHAAARFFLERYPREEDGCLRYVPHRRELLVDTIGMICPFLAGYGRHFTAPAATELAHVQLSRFIDVNLDPFTGLPYHGYLSGGPYRLGLHGWGRGVGWFATGLVDTIIELGGYRDTPLRESLRRIGHALTKWQRPDGHWAWIVPMPEEPADSSVTAFCGYALARAAKNGLLSDNVARVLDHARSALLSATDRNGIVTQASGECKGLGVYSMHFGPQPWAQAATAAFFAEWPPFTYPNMLSRSSINKE